MSLKFRDFCFENDFVTFKDRNKVREAVRMAYSEIHETPLNDDGSICYVTKQGLKGQCEINSVIKKYPQKIINARLVMDEAKFADVSGADFQRSMNVITDVTYNFSKLPSKIRNKFGNDPAKYLNYLAEPGVANIDDINRMEDTKKETKVSTVEKTEENKTESRPDGT